MKRTLIIAGAAIAMLNIAAVTRWVEHGEENSLDNTKMTHTAGAVKVTYYTEQELQKARAEALKEGFFEGVKCGYLASRSGEFSEIEVTFTLRAIQSHKDRKSAGDIHVAEKSFEY